MEMASAGAAITPLGSLHSGVGNNHNHFFLHACYSFCTVGSGRVTILSSERLGISGVRNAQRWWRTSSKIRVEKPRFSKREYSNYVDDRTEEPRPPFNLDLAVLLAGFAFESYNSPPKDEGVREMDNEDCETTYLSKEYVQELYDGQLCVKLKNGSNFPGLDLWGTSDPYVVLRIADCRVRSKTVWATKDPVWNEELDLNVKDPTNQILKVAAWDANLVTAHRRLGNSAISLENLCDGKSHNLEIELEGMGGGGTVNFQVQYRSFSQIESEKDSFSLARIFRVDVLEKAFKSVVGESQISVADLLNFYRPSGGRHKDGENAAKASVPAEESSRLGPQGTKDRGFAWEPFTKRTEGAEDRPEGEESSRDEELDKDDDVAYWRTMADALSDKLKPLGLDLSALLADRDETGKLREDVKKIGLASQEKAKLEYIKQGLTLEECENLKNEMAQAEGDTNLFGLDSILRQGLSPPESVDNLRKQTEKLIGIWAMFAKSTGSPSGEEDMALESVESKNSGYSERALPERFAPGENQEMEDSQSAMFSTAESAMEAWALLATTLGGASLVKSDFKKICFVENGKTDTQVAIWRDQVRRRLVVAFRGTEQTKWKDVITDLSLLATGFNPERVDGGGSREVLVHGGFLTAYDSVKAKLLSLVRSSISLSNNNSNGENDWHIYVTGHSLGGALATLFALDLASFKISSDGNVFVTMYNYGSPRVGNRHFAETYNKTVKDSWRVVNHRDIVPTVPRLMGYCHVAQPIYLTTTQDSSVMSDLLDDGYQGDVIGEATADVILENIMKGEQRVLQRLLDTEIAMLRAMRDGSAVMQHMEDFYYITLLQRVEARISHGRRNHTQ